MARKPPGHVSTARRTPAPAPASEPFERALAAGAAKRTVDGGGERGPDRHQGKSDRCLAVETHMFLDDGGQHDAQEGEDQSPSRIAQQPAILQPADGAALACGQRSGAALNGAGIPPADDLKTPAAQQGQYQAQCRAEAEAQAPRAAGAKRYRRNGRGAVVRIPHSPDRKHIQGEELEHHSDSEPRLDVTYQPARYGASHEWPRDHGLRHADQVETDERSPDQER